MIIRLGIDASQYLASCAISKDGEIIAAATTEKPIENLAKLIKDTITTATIDLADINEIVTCIGPGSQTGIRTSVVTGNTLSFALGVPISGVLSIDAAAGIIDGLEEPNRIAVSAGRKRWYMSDYRKVGGLIQRISGITIEDELPTDSIPLFAPSLKYNTAENSCAVGCLKIVAEQEHLVEQLRVTELYPFERGGVR